MNPRPQHLDFGVDDGNQSFYKASIRRGVVLPGPVVCAGCARVEGRNHGRTKIVSKFEGALPVEQYEERDCQFCIKMPSFPTDQGRAQETSRPFAAIGDSEVEMEACHDGHYCYFSSNKEGERWYIGDCGSVDDSWSVLGCEDKDRSGRLLVEICGGDC